MLKKLYALKNKKGFTLVELMVVVAILGILVAVAVPVYNSVTEKAQKNACAANLRTIESAVMQATIDGVDAASIDTMASLNKYLKDADKLSCPKDGDLYTIADGVPTCPNNHTIADAEG